MSDVRYLQNKCQQLELDNRELTKHIKVMIENHSDTEHIEMYKTKVQVLEKKITSLAQQNLDLVQKVSFLEEEKFRSKSNDN